ncbi:MAG: DNA repair exonuclease [Candidatus Krumholzibacteria bacterium]|nr:DNA repair exonuclease [Candidatus Krumholzibacteria bacterium]
MDTLRMLHTADVHIGAPFKFLGTKGNEQRLALREALARMVGIAREGRYHVLAIAGDLFDSAFDSTETDVSFVIGLLHDAGERCHVVILPGSHDYYAPGSIYEREMKRFEAGGNVHILTPEKRVIEIPHISLAVHGKALSSNVAADSALAGLAPVGHNRWNVCLAHCSVAGFSADLDGAETSARLEDLAEGFDYVALGHWHSYRIIREQAPPVLYSGSPEIVARDQQGAGFAVSVSLSDEGVAFERVSVGKRRIGRHSLDCTGVQSTEEFVKKVLAAVPADPDLILELSLGGLIGIESALDPERGSAELERRYFSVRLAGKGPSREISREELLAAPEDTVAGTFVRRMLKRIEESEGEERALREEALQLAFQLFKGRDLIG